jgi:hypothetical protein
VVSFPLSGGLVLVSSPQLPIANSATTTKGKKRFFIMISWFLKRKQLLKMQ